MEYMSPLSNYLRSGRLSPANAAQPRCKLLFPQSLINGRFGRARMNGFPARQYSRGAWPARQLDDPLMEATRWWVEALAPAAPRKLSRSFGSGPPRQAAFLRPHTRP